MPLEMYDEYSPFDWDDFIELYECKCTAKQFADDVEKWINRRKEL